MGPLTYCCRELDSGIQNCHNPAPEIASQPLAHPLLLVRAPDHAFGYLEEDHRSERPGLPAMSQHRFLRVRGTALSEFLVLLTCRPVARAGVARQLKGGDMVRGDDMIEGRRRAGGRHRGGRSWLRRAGSVALSLVTAGVLVAACGGSPASPKAAQSQTRQSAELAYSSCIRAHGVPNFPDPQPGGGYRHSAISAIGGQNSPQLLSSQKACHAEAVAAGFVHPPAQIRRHVQQLRAESACMRKHGVPDMPDPNAEGKMIFPPGGPNPSQPQFQAAQKKCAYLNP